MNRGVGKGFRFCERILEVLQLSPSQLLIVRLKRTKTGHEESKTMGNYIHNPLPSDSGRQASIDGI